jgi:hypothetical protein
MYAPCRTALYVCMYAPCRTALHQCMQACRSRLSVLLCLYCLCARGDVAWLNCKPAGVVLPCIRAGVQEKTILVRMAAAQQGTAAIPNGEQLCACLLLVACMCWVQAVVQVMVYICIEWCVAGLLLHGPLLSGAPYRSTPALCCSAVQGRLVFGAVLVVEVGKNRLLAPLPA